MPQQLHRHPIRAPATRDCACDEEEAKLCCQDHVNRTGHEMAHYAAAADRQLDRDRSCDGRLQRLPHGKKDGNEKYRAARACERRAKTDNDSDASDDKRRRCRGLLLAWAHEAVHTARDQKQS